MFLHLNVNLISPKEGVDKTWGRPWPTLWPNLWPTGGQIFKNRNKTSVRVEQGRWDKIISLKWGYTKKSLT